MIGKIFKCIYADYYYKVTHYNNGEHCIGVVIKSNTDHLPVGGIYTFLLDDSEEISEEQFNKIMVFE